MGELTDFFNKKYNSENLLEIETIEDCWYSFGKASDILLYQSLFQPRIVDILGYKLLELNLHNLEAKSNFIKKMHDVKEGYQDLQASFNFIEIGYLFDTKGRDTSDDMDLKIALILRNSWDAWLSHLYPELDFIVEIVDEFDTGSTVGLQFYQKKKSSQPSLKDK